jgi:hypothetical protein
MTNNKLPHLTIHKNSNLFKRNRYWNNYDITDDDILNDHNLKKFKDCPGFHHIMINKPKTTLRIEDSFGSGLMYDLKNKKIIEQYFGD